MYTFLVVYFVNDIWSVKVALSQGGLTNKVLKTVVILDSNNNTTPETTMTLGTGDYGPPFNELWGYASVVVILMYLPINSRPDIHFSVHQCASLTQNSRKIRAESLKNTCRYLV